MAQRLVVEIVGDDTSLRKALDRSSKESRKFGVQMQGLSRTASKAGAFAAAGFYGTQGLISALKISVGAASNLAEQMSKTNQVFGRSADDIKAWSKTSAASMGLARDQALQVASTFGALLRPLGVTGEEAARQSERLTQLGADLASFYNTDVQDALDAIRSGLVGESEPLRRYGVLLSETRVQQQALADTGKENADQLTAQDKLYARIALVLKDTTQAQGDFARTSGGAANQLRILEANTRNFATTLGSVLLPVLTKAAQGLNALFEAFGTANNISFAGAVQLKKLQDMGVTALGRRYDPVEAARRGAPGRLPGLVPVQTLLDQVRSFTAVGQANSTIGQLVQFINKWKAAGDRFDAAQKAREASQKAAAARRARMELQRRRFQQGLENQLGWLDFGIERAETTKTLADDRRALRKKEAWLENRIKHEGRTLNRVRELWRVRQQIRDLNKKKAADGDPLAGLMQVSSRRLAAMLAAGTGIGPGGVGRLRQNIAAAEIQPVYVGVNIDGREVGRAVARADAQQAHRTSRQTSGRRG